MKLGAGQFLTSDDWLQALLDKLQDGSVGTGNNGVIAGVLATVGELARVVCDHNFNNYVGRCS